MSKRITPWKIIEEKNVSPSKWFPLYVHTIELPDGKVIDDYYVSKLGDVAMIVAITPNNEIVFARQYKHGVRDIILELPAGRVGNKSPEEAAKDELREETGIIADRLFPIGHVFVAPSKDSTITYGFLMENARVQTEQKPDETEDIELIYVPTSELDQMIMSGKIRGSDTISLITLARLHHPELF